MAWNYKPGVPIYQQIVSIMKAGIASGTYPAGSRVPTVREMALEAGVNPNTMQRAFAEMEREGYFYSVRTSGRYVTEETEKLKDLRKSLSQAHIGELFRQLRGLGMKDEEILTAVREWTETEGREPAAGRKE